MRVRATYNPLTAAPLAGSRRRGCVLAPRLVVAASTRASHDARGSGDHSSPGSSRGSTARSGGVMTLLDWPWRLVGGLRSTWWTMARCREAASGFCGGRRSLILSGSPSAATRSQRCLIATRRPGRGPGYPRPGFGMARPRSWRPGPRRAPRHERCSRTSIRRVRTRQLVPRVGPLRCRLSIARRDESPFPKRASAQSGRPDLNRRPFGPQPGSNRWRCVPERPPRPRRSRRWAIWTNRT